MADSTAAAAAAQQQEGGTPTNLSQHTPSLVSNILRLRIVMLCCNVNVMHHMTLFFCVEEMCPINDDRFTCSIYLLINISQHHTISSSSRPLK